MSGQLFHLLTLTGLHRHHPGHTPRVGAGPLRLHLAPLLPHLLLSGHPWPGFQFPCCLPCIPVQG